MASVKENTVPRIPWITGLKGLACCGVFLHHLSMNFDTDVYFGTAPSGLTWLLSSTPLGVVINGNFYVFLFLMLSSFLIGNSFVGYEGQDLGSKAISFCIKRYFRLMLPVLAYALLRQGFVLLWNATFGNCNLPAYPGWGFAIKHAVFDVFAYDDTALAGPLWMMNHLFVGSYIALILSLPNRKKHAPTIILLYCFALCFMIKRDIYYLAAAVCGVLLVDLQPLLRKLAEKKLYRPASTVLILGGLLLGGVPNMAVPYPFFLYSPLIPYWPILHLMAAFALLLGIQWQYAHACNSPAKPNLLLRFLQTAPLQFLGRICYSMFLIHEAVIILLYGAPRKLCEGLAPATAVFTVLGWTVLISAVTITASWLFYRFFEQNTNKLCNRIRL